MDNLVSVIIPVYKTEKYLKKCIDSILCQSFQDFEIVLVDDGSPDNSGKICDEYAHSDSRVKVLHRENSGVGGARNAALDIAVGDYVTFVDSDDTLPPDALEKLVSTLWETSADMVGGALATVRGKRVNSPRAFSGSFCGDEIAMHLFDIYSASPVSCCKLFSRNIIENNNIRFMKNVPFAEDTYFFMQFVKCSQKLVFIPDVIYYYNRGNSSSATSKFYAECDRYNIYNFEKVKEIIDESNLSDSAKSRSLSMFADKLCCEVINHYMINSKSSDLLRQKIGGTVDFYREFVSWNFSGCSSMIISPRAALALKDGRVGDFIGIWQRDNRKALIKHRIKTAIVHMRLI